MSEKNILCIIPARGGSKRIPRKNIVELCGKPMLAYTIEAAEQSKLFDRVIVSTEDDEIAAVAEKYGAYVEKRNKELATDKATVLDVCLDLLEKYENEGQSFDYICILLPTSPLRTGDDLVNAFKKFEESDGNALMAVTTYAISPFWALKEDNGFLVPYFGEKYMVRSQDLPEVFVDNGAVYVFKIDTLKQERRFFCSKLVPFEMPRERSIDVDEKVDLELAEFFLSKKEGGK